MVWGAEETGGLGTGACSSFDMLAGMECSAYRRVKVDC